MMPATVQTEKKQPHQGQWNTQEQKNLKHNHDDHQYGDGPA